MAIYSTFFVVTAATLASGFPGWKLPLPHPISRVVSDFLGTRTIQTQEPDWDVKSPTPVRRPPAPSLMTIQGSYEGYLESRLPAFVRDSPHWCGKNLTPVELDPLGKLTEGKPVLIAVLYGPPSNGGIVYEFRASVLKAIASSPDEWARQWATYMSRSEFTHSTSGNRRLSPDWTTEDALRIIKPLMDLAPKISGDSKLYLMID